MAEYVAVPTPFPCSVALFTCSCGAKTVEYDPKTVAPTGWSTTEDGAARCPECTERASD